MELKRQERCIRGRLCYIISNSLQHLWGWWYAVLMYSILWSLIYVLGLNFRFLALPHPGLAIYRHCIELESNLASTGDKTGLANARKLYDSALATYDQDASLWRDYHCMEIKV